MTTLKILLHQEIIEQKKFDWRKHSWVSSLAKKNNIHGYQESDICYGVYSFFFSYDRFYKIKPGETYTKPAKILPFRSHKQTWSLYFKVKTFFVNSRSGSFLSDITQDIIFISLLSKDNNIHWPCTFYIVICEYLKPWRFIYGKNECAFFIGRTVEVRNV